MENIDLQMGINMKAWQNPYNFTHKYSGQMVIRVPRQFQDVDVTNKDTLDFMDENILKCS